MIMRLETVEKGLVEKLKLVSEEQRRSAVKVACELAFQACPVEVPIVVESLRQLRSGNKLTTDQISELDALAAQLDEKYFDLQDSLDEGQNLNVEGLQLFSQARAVSALSLAGGENSLMAAAEAIYEASSAVDDGTQIFKAVLSGLPKS
ncbi:MULTISPECIES: hypothetical protein [Pseudomonas]|uniref:Uncharacterized protein n=1 Tax=Pseudomonas pergaminensis TaxID=2853159 RepID=A0ABD7TIS1_9PSED|nr:MULTISPECIES: hypothetical protein [Pseudomonas]AQT91860.1 hypothetical protein B1R45_00795 [Pseudomonas azotoformans]MBT1263791.1 hypothetical protein [Pseudomonas sp. VS40]MBT1275706.1 hypothetical protein [Pseudomonas sp. VS59]PJK35465.1 hypothetical protein CWC49_19915 [Pseudomonas sp. S09F 262]PJK39406.1 hypothetical protein CWC48_09760 [Pseudomonas sp. S10E 269]